MITTNRSCHPLQQPCLLVVSTIFLLAAATFAQPPPPPPPGGAPIYHIYFDIRSKTFDELRLEILAVLLTFSSTLPYNPPQVGQIYVLGPQRLNFLDEPPAWIYIHVIVGEEKEDKVTLAMAIDDLYIMGFSNGTEHWYKFGGGFKGLPGAVVLPIQYNYRDLIDGGHKFLWKVPLGKKSATHATKELATYDPEITSKDQLKDGVVRFVVMMSEGMRLREIRETFSGNNWEKETFISTDQANSVVDWGTLSKLLIRWDLTRTRQGGAKWGGGEFTKHAEKVKRNSKVTGATQAENKLDVLLRPKETILELVS